VEGVSAIGGGSAPGAELPTRLITIESDRSSPSQLEARLRAGDPPVIARIHNDCVVIDLRTVAEQEENELVHAIVHAQR